ncbi:hypothetical protein KVR01_000523 [Diaporthe batatas]|uniref:uncharacterized protein n=1 Tax=Diaporthe batatas TaxID=748121 RepID=UPI001D057300|nr:uncharacterized protein KVR01_000523 [Diaporthe batatas]KAG8169778.1 hypothetical protein KVR01_000523 [Diaporthe batatas]
MARRRGAASSGIVRRAEATRRATRPPAQNTRVTRSSASQADGDALVPVVYKQMLRESGALPSRMTSEATERPLKRRRTGRQAAQENTGDNATSGPSVRASSAPTAEDNASEDDDEDIEFEDVDIPKPTLQTTYRDSSDDESGEDAQFEDVDFDAVFSNSEQAPEQSRTLELNLTAAKEALAPSRRAADRRKPITKEEKELRVEVHKAHLLCLLAHVEKRNHWCNDPVVQESLRPLLTAKIVQWLNPESHLTQFGQTESLKKGLQMIMEKFQKRFAVTEIGLRRALWAEDEKQLENYGLPDDIDSCLEKADFRKAAKRLTGSRDVGAQLFCALLRAAGVETRLVCSLQPLSLAPGGPTLPKTRQAKPPPRPPAVTVEVAQAEQPASAAVPSPRARLGHPNAAAYIVPEISAPPENAMPRIPPRQPHPPRESDFPVYWVEVLDAAHQKWQPVDALVTYTLFRPNKIEPPAADRANCLTYVIAFEEDGSGKDVTRRYTKAYNAKTRRMRVDGPLIPEDSGRKWWRKVMRRYRQPGHRSDLDQIEDNELSGFEAREPMPRNVADFKDHPVYALERHMRRHEVLAPDAPVVGKVGAGSKGPLERIYRRRDVRAAKSVDKWYRLGREINPGEEPVKVLPKRKRPQRRGRRAFDDDHGDSSSSSDDPVLGPKPSKGVPIFTFDQTSLYVPPPVVAGRIPKNKFGNLDLYVPSMVPAGGAHIPHPRAGHAAHILGVDYAPALTGFDWRGRKGTAVYNGVVVPAEAEEGVRAVIDGFEDLEAMLEEEKRSKRALAAWKRLLKGMRIRKSVFGDEDMFDESIPLEDFPVDATEDEEMDSNDPDQDGGGFEPEYSQAGGFEPGGFEPGGFEPGGFEPGGFEPGGFEPGGFEPGGFEPGSFEPDNPNMDVKGKGKATEYDPDHRPVPTPEETTVATRRLRVRRRVVESDDEEMEDEQDAVAAAEATESGDHNMQPETERAEPGGFETEPALQDPPAVEETEPIVTATGTIGGTTQEDTDMDGTETGGDLGAAIDGTTDADVETVGKPGDPEEVRGEVERSQPDNDEDPDLEDAASDVTEELYMDEDGSLIE